MNYKLKVDEDLCSGCGNCVVACPVNARSSVEIGSGKGADYSNLELDLGIQEGVAYVVNPEICTGCGVCIAVCSNDAVTIDAIKPSEASKLKKVEDLEIFGDRSRVYGIIKEKGPITISDIAKETELPGKIVYLHVLSLKKDDKIWEDSAEDGEYSYTAERVVEKEAEEEAKLPKIDPKAAREFREKINRALASFEGVKSVKIRSLIEKGEVDKAREAVKLRKKKGG